MNTISLVSEELAYYILSKKSANLPGFGRFEAVYHEAKVNAQNGTLSAPKESVRFISESNEDESFSSHLKALFPNQDILSDFKLAVNETLAKDQAVVLTDLGKYSVSDSGVGQFEYIDETDHDFDFAWDDIQLKPITIAVEPTVVADPSAPGAATEPLTTNVPQAKAFPYLRIGMIASALALCLAMVFNRGDDIPLKATAQQVNVNISPKNIKKEVFTASINPEIQGEILDAKDQAEILERQEAMTAVVDQASMLSAIIITNTFGNQANVQKQINQIKALGYQGDTVLRDNGLTATFFNLDYTNESDLADKLAEIKKDFPRAKIKK